MDAYSILGVKRNANTEEINNSFKTLMDKYSEDKYIGNPLSDLAAGKRRELESAYDYIIKNRAKMEKEAKENQTNTAGEAAYTNSSSSDVNPAYTQIRNYIDIGNIASARQMLEEIQVRDAQWHYLWGCMAMRQGSYNDAYNSFKTAVNKDPSNEEYRVALMRMDQQAKNYRNVGGGMQEQQCCNCCSNLVCADCCCECMGGDLIPCC